ncbi:MAG: CPBP family intramembrane metalloprotease [Bacilli bacterium]|nr:CPBP family intramembrane metalloprotease [Bacilli bacterium]
MKKFFEKNEFLITMMFIFLYVLINSFCINNLGLFNYKTLIINTLFSIILFLIIFLLKKTSYYGIKKVKNLKKYIYFLPLLLIISVNFWNGITINNTFEEIIIYMIIMLNIGFIEEVIFRGFLFKMMEKSNVKTAIIVSSLTFGIGHIINLFNGAATIDTFLQIIYATSLGFLFALIFYKSKSLIPCIITHSLLNAFSIFNSNNDYIVTAILLTISCFYSFYIIKFDKD